MPGIIDLANSSKSPPSLEEKKKRCKARLISIGKNVLDSLTTAHGLAVETVWNNRLGLTPEQVGEALGSDGQQLFGMLVALREFVEAVQPGHIDYEMPGTVTPKPDGTLTLVPAPAPASVAEADGATTAAEAPAEKPKAKTTKNT